MLASLFPLATTDQPLYPLIHQAANSLQIGHLSIKPQKRESGASHENNERERESASVLSVSSMKFSGKELKLALLNFGDKSRPIHCGHRESDIAQGWQLPK